jgi:WD40 repeat protein
MELVGHKESVNDAAFSPTGNILATASSDNTVKVWNANTGKMLHSINAHKQSLQSVRFSPDGGLFVTTGGDGFARLWKTSDGSLFLELPRNEIYAKFAEFSKDGVGVLVKGSGTKVNVWLVERAPESMKEPAVEVGKKIETKTQESTPIEEDPWFLTSLGANGRDTLFSPDGSSVVLFSYDTDAKLISVETGKKLFSFGYGQAVFSPDGAYVMMLDSSSFDGPVLWDTKSGEKSFTLPEDVNIAIFSPDSKHLATSNQREKTTKLWDLSSKEQRSLKGHKYRVKILQYSKDGASLLTVGRNKKAKIVDTKTGETTRKIRGLDARVDKALFVNNESVLFVMVDKIVSLRDSKTGKSSSLQGRYLRSSRG